MRQAPGTYAVGAVTCSGYCGLGRASARQRSRINNWLSRTGNRDEEHRRKMLKQAVKLGSKGIREGYEILIELLT